MSGDRSRPDLRDDAGTPLWVKVFAMILLLLLVLIVAVVILTGGHGPGAHTP